MEFEEPDANAPTESKFDEAKPVMTPPPKTPNHSEFPERDSPDEGKYAEDENDNAEADITAKTYYDEEGHEYHLDHDGQPYYLDADGNGFYVDEEGHAYYYDQDGVPYYLDENGDAFYVDDNGAAYYVDQTTGERKYWQEYFDEVGDNGNEENRDAENAQSDEGRQWSATPHKSSGTPSPRAAPRNLSGEDASRSASKPCISPMRSPYVKANAGAQDKGRSQWESQRSPAATAASHHRVRSMRNASGKGLRPKTPPMKKNNASSSGELSLDDSGNSSRGSSNGGRPQFRGRRIRSRHRRSREVESKTIESKEQYSDSSAEGSSGSDSSSDDSSSDEDEGDGYDIIFSRARHGHFAEVVAALKGGMPVEARDAHGNTLLLVACQNGHKKLVKICLRAGANINAVNKKGNTGLHFCFLYGMYSLGEYMLSKGADDTLTNEDGATCYEASA